MLKLFQKAPKPGEEDKPWSIGKSVQFGLSHEATGDLLEVWAASLAIGREFTIRQAKWACYLRSASLVAENRGRLTGYTLYYFSAIYANRERICQVFNTSGIDTSDLDVPLGLTTMEIHAAQKTGVLDKMRLISFPEELPQDGINKVPHVLTADIEALQDLGIGSAPSFFDAWFEAWWDRFDLPQDAPRVYAYWIRFISKTPKWETLSFKEQKDFVLKLKNDIEVEATAKMKAVATTYGKPSWEPTEIIKALDILKRD